MRDKIYLVDVKLNEAWTSSLSGRQIDGQFFSYFNITYIMFRRKKFFNIDLRTKKLTTNCRQNQSHKLNRFTQTCNYGPQNYI